MLGSSVPHPESLYNGAVGVALLAGDLARPERSCMPLFERDGWAGVR